MTDRQKAIMIGCKEIAEFSYRAVGELDFFGELFTASVLEKGLRSECENLLKLIALTDNQYNNLGG